MKNALHLAAIDLGAESGRAMLASIEGGRIELSTALRFPNRPVRTPDALHWDVLRLYADVLEGLSCIARDRGGDIAGIGVDTWGVDFALLDRSGALLGNPVHYRDERTSGILESAFARVSREEIFAHTGIQFMEINTLYQLFSMARQGSPLLGTAATFLTIPDLLNYWLTGRTVCEFTNATTTQFFDPTVGDWSRPLLERLGVPTAMLPPIVQPGTVLGPLLDSVATQVGLGPVPVVAPACHDTGSAVVAVPSTSGDSAWISSGTWSVLGAEAAKPVINADSLEFNFTNEGGVAGTYRVCKNVMGLWLLQECRRKWTEDGASLTYEEIVATAGRAAPLQCLVDPDDAAFLRPGDMPRRVADYCRSSGQPEPADRGAIVRCILESLALKYRFQLERLDHLLGRRLATVHIVGGGSQNALLCQMTANATGRPVVAGPVEATALGNALMQAIALGHLSSVAEARQVVAASSALKTYEPTGVARWDDVYDGWLRLIGQDVGAG